MAEKPRSEYSEMLRESASRVLQSGELGSGQILPKLFEYLVERALAGEVPKEFDIAVDVFGKNSQHGDGGDAQIRVWIYRLRSRLERYYSGAGVNDPVRIEIPKGTYKIGLHDKTRDQQAPPARSSPKLGYAIGILALASALAVLAGFFFDRVTPRHESLASDPVWSGIADSQLPILIVLGDHFFFGDPDSHTRIRDIYINSENELRQSAMFKSNPDLVFDTLSYLPKSAAFGLPAILSRVNAMDRNYALKLASDLTPEDLRVADVVFVGFIRSMGVLREYYSRVSNFKATAPYLEIVHGATGNSFVRTGPLPRSNTDYGLFARLVGPTGNQLLLFSGIGDPGVLATARALNSTEGVRRLKELVESSSVDSSSNWEVLLEVEGHSRTDLDYRLIGLFPIEGRPTHNGSQAHHQATR